jgi:Plant transposon protein
MVYAQWGFPGAIGCVDCASWEWDACPVAWQGNHKGISKKPCNRMEIVCDDYQYIWHVMFGTPGSKNEINILHYSTLFKKIRTGAWPPCRPETVISGMPLTWYYYLVDGIYHRFRIFVSTFSNPRNLKENLFGKHQERARKSVERVFGVLFKRFQILYRPSRLWHKSDMLSIVEACSNTKIPQGNRHAHICARLLDRGSDDDPRLSSLHLR